MHAGVHAPTDRLAGGCPGRAGGSGELRRGQVSGRRRRAPARRGLRRRKMTSCAGLAAAHPGGAAPGGGGYGPGPGARTDTRAGTHGRQGALKPPAVSPQMCEKFTVCENSMEMLVQNNLNLPKVTEEDGCLLSGFNEERCLRKLSSGLFTFQTYLEYVQETFTSERQKVESLCYSTKHLATTIRQMVINPDEVIIPDSATQKSLLAKLKSDKTWIEKITTHLILRDFTSFMEKTVRAVRYLKNTRSISV
uniref:Interleukin-6 n=1 Tax=Dromaius novaehollandiae TaxID=8790 RepID=A0A8C4KNA4_DRONO